MGCGSSGALVTSQEDPKTPGKLANGNNMSNGHRETEDDLPTLVLPDSPMHAKPPIAFEIPVEDFDGNRRPSNTPPVHLQRLLQPPQNDIRLPDIEEKLAEAEQRRLTILQQRAVSAQNRIQKMMRSVHNMETRDPEHELTEASKIGTKTLTIPPEPGVCEDKNIS